MATDRFNVFPSRANLVLIKQRIVAATRGLNLLKRKRDALELKLRDLIVQLKAAQAVVDEVMAEAIISMAKANFLDADLRACEVLQSSKADIYMHIKNTKVAGLLLPQFQLFVETPGSFPLTGLSRGGEQVEIVRERYRDAVRTLIAIASLEYSVNTLQDGVHKNNMRVNGLEHIVIPRFQNTVIYIRNELEEYEREDFYRLKRSQAKQRKAKESFSRMVKLRNMSPEELAAFNMQQAHPKSSIVSAGFADDFDINSFLPEQRSSGASGNATEVTSELRASEQRREDSQADENDQ